MYQIVIRCGGHKVIIGSVDIKKLKHVMVLMIYSFTIFFPDLSAST